jgi:hypothetical protein
MMYQDDADILFPARVIPQLRNLRGQEWQVLIDGILQCPEGSIEEQALCLLMIRLDGCLTCHADSYRAMRGCTLCAQQTIARFKSSDADLIVAYEQARTDLHRWMATGEIPASERLSGDMDSGDIESNVFTPPFTGKSQHV